MPHTIRKKERKKQGDVNSLIKYSTSSAAKKIRRSNKIKVGRKFVVFGPFI